MPTNKVNYIITVVDESGIEVSPPIRGVFMYLRPDDDDDDITWSDGRSSNSRDDGSDADDVDDDGGGYYSVVEWVEEDEHDGDSLVWIGGDEPEWVDDKEETEEEDERVVRYEDLDDDLYFVDILAGHDEDQLFLFLTKTPVDPKSNGFKFTFHFKGHVEWRRPEQGRPPEEWPVLFGQQEIEFYTKMRRCVGSRSCGKIHYRGSYTRPDGVKKEECTVCMQRLIGSVARSTERREARKAAKRTARKAARSNLAT